MKKKIFLTALSMICVLTVSACGTSETDEFLSSEPEVDSWEEDDETDIEIVRSDTEFSEATMEETVLFDAEGITVTATGFDADAAYGPEIAIRVTNDSARSVLIGAEDVTVNDFMMEPGLLYMAVESGETAEDALMLYDFLLDSCGIRTVATVSLSVTVTDEETFEEIAIGDRVTLTTSAAAGFSQEADDQGDVLYDADGIRVICQGLQQDADGSCKLTFYLENNTESYIGVSAEDVSVNGLSEEYAILWSDLLAQTKAVTDMYLDDFDDQEIERIEDVREISFQLVIYDQDSWDTLGMSDFITLQYD